jgi:hypothetical protein
MHFALCTEVDILKIDAKIPNIHCRVNHVISLVKRLTMRNLSLAKKTTEKHVRNGFGGAITFDLDENSIILAYERRGEGGESTRTIQICKVLDSEEEVSSALYD